MKIEAHSDNFGGESACGEGTGGGRMAAGWG